ncbi:hypothetical protein pb186bvf_005989 [Paramecium bursaria]
MDLYHFLFKYIIVGDTNVGKSCLLLNYTEGRFKEEHDTTIGVEFGSQIFNYKGKLLKIQIWDTAGQESFRSITRSYYKGSIGVLLVFDLTNRDSFYNIIKWYNEVLDCAHDNVQIVMVGNKYDLEEDRQVSIETAKSFAEQHKLLYFETSAKTGYNVNTVFEDIAITIFNKIDKGQIDFNNDSNGIKLGTYYKTEQEEEMSSIGRRKQKKPDCC